MPKKIAKLQFITQGHNPEEHLLNAKKVLDKGCNWIQLRLKDVEDFEGIKIAYLLKKEIEKYEGTFIINDKWKWAHEVGADGVHLGLQDNNPIDVRKHFTNDFIIGGTSNTFEDILKQVNNEVNYIGLGPYRQTKTKKNLNPILGQEGTKEIIKKVIKNNIKIPIILVGGIILQDIKEIEEMGFWGVAMSGGLLI